MNTKAYSILFSVLLASTFIHDVRAKASANPSFISRIVKRDVILPGRCRWVCDPPILPVNEPRLIIVANVKANIFSVTNQTAQASFVVDIKANLIAAFNGSTGEGVVINITSNTGVTITEGGWSGADESIKDYIASLTNGLTPLFKSGNSEFQVDNAPPAVLQAVNRVLIKLIIDLSLQVQSSPKIGLQLFVALGGGIVVLFRGSLNGYIKLFPTSDNLLLTRDLAASYTVFQALGVIFAKIPGGVNAVIKSGVDFSNEGIIQSGDGLNRLVYIIRVLGSKFNLGVALGSVLNDVQSFFKLIADLGGNGNIGADGLFRVLSVIVGYVKGDGTSLEIVISAIIRFLAANQKNQAENKNLSARINASLSKLLEAVGKVGASGKLSGLIITIKALLDGTLVVKEVSISAIEALLISGISGQNQLQILVAVLLQLKPIVDPSISIPSAIVVLIINLHNPLGILLLQGIGIVIDISIGLGIIGSILVNILRGILNLIGLLIGNIFNALISLPIISDILRGLAKALTDVSNNGLDLRLLITGNKEIRILIIGLFQVISGINLGVNKNVTSQAEVLLRNCSSVNFYLTLDLDYTIITV